MGLLVWDNIDFPVRIPFGKTPHAWKAMETGLEKTQNHGSASRRCVILKLLFREHGKTTKEEGTA